MLGIRWREWWWVVCCCTAATSIYFHNIQEKKLKVAELSCRLDEMNREKLLAMQERDALRLQIDSQNDPSWIEMILMRDLGVVPEGWLKVHFTK
jgi:hypothetical protein